MQRKSAKYIFANIPLIAPLCLTGPIELNYSKEGSNENTKAASINIFQASILIL